jgi:hypothetical protein
MATGSIRIGLAAVFMITGTAFCQLRTDKLGVGLTGTGSSFRGDSPSSGTRYGGCLSLMYSVASHIGIRATFQFDQMQFTQDVTRFQYVIHVLSGNLALSYDFMPNSRLNPFLLAGIGRAYDSGIGIDQQTILPGSGFDVHLLVGGGLDFFASEFVSMTLMEEYVMTGSDLYDGLKAGGGNDRYLRTSVQIRYYFFDETFLKKILDAMKHRYDHR